MRLTTHRREILELLQHTPGTRTAGELHATLPHINLVTIYRALEYLVTAGAVKKVHLSADEAHYEVQETPHHHAICTECGKVIHFSTNDAELQQEFSLPGFVVHELDVTLRGRCRNHAT